MSRLDLIADVASQVRVRVVMRAGHLNLVEQEYTGRLFGVTFRDKETVIELIEEIQGGIRCISIVLPLPSSVV